MAGKLRLAPGVILNSGHKMPTMGLGTASHPRPPLDELTSIFLNAIAAGFRHFDSASIYGTEEAIGRAVREAVARGIISSRDEVFVTSKLYMNVNQRDLVLPAIQETLSKLGMEYVDLYQVHWPVRIKEGSVHFALAEEEMLHFEMEEVWEAMEEIYKKGLAKSIGVGNFSCAKLERLLKSATIPPAVNQVEMNAGWQQRKLMKFCKEKGIHVCGWSPLGANGAYWGTLAVIDSPALKEIAAARNKSVAQVALKWIHQAGATPIVKTFNKERMEQNLGIFEWEDLTEEEMGKIEKIPQARGYSGDTFVFPNGQYKSVEELWDGEV